MHLILIFVVYDALDPSELPHQGRADPQPGRLGQGGLAAVQRNARRRPRHRPAAARPEGGPVRTQAPGRPAHLHRGSVDHPAGQEGPAARIRKTEYRAGDGHVHLQRRLHPADRPAHRRGRQHPGRQHHLDRGPAGRGRHGHRHGAQRHPAELRRRTDDHGVQALQGRGLHRGAGLCGHRHRRDHRGHAFCLPSTTARSSCRTAPCPTATS